ncbi:inositol monophosphatase family protein [Tepidiforma sp.]|uniref:inositol monophosphatase family protein n=1 Tax=Tepidiforma sp. TaxID=2682230 RepID=UPI002ADD8483|nr:inositol monophosphatase family protein [Tepidiforma sp.]
MSAGTLAEELLLLAVRTAREAGELIGQYATEGFAVGTKSTATDMVTEADRAAERLIAERLLGARPEDGILGEEGASEPGSSGVRWVVDPLDGTTNFVYGIPAYAVAIAAEVDGEVVAGVVHDVAHGLTYAAALGGGATCNGRPIRVREGATLATALVATGFAYDAARRARQAELLRLVLPRVRDIRRMGSAALDLVHVACGRLDGYFEYRLNPWDIAAGGLIVREAGGRTGGFGGFGFVDGYVVAAGAGLFGELCALVDAAWRATAGR